MFEFGRELRRIFRNPGKVETDTSLYELMNLQLLITQGRGLDIEAGRVSTKDRFTPAIESAQIWREYARRTGDPVALKRAANAAESAGREAHSVAEATTAALEQAETCVLSFDLFGASDLLQSAERLIGECRIGAQDDEALTRRMGRIEAQIAARVAHQAGVVDLDPALEAMAHIDRAIDIADTRVRQGKASRDKIDAARMRFERADLLLRVGLDREDPSLCDAVIRDFEALRDRLDPAYEPITFAGILLRLSRALVAKGQIEGRPEIISEGIAVLNADEAQIDYEHSPIDWAEQKQAVALGLVALGDLVPNDEIFDKAQAVHDTVLRRPLQKGSVLRAHALDQRARCVVRRAEATGDLKVVDAAEAALKTDIRAVNPQEDSVAWAVLQLNLARLYVVRGDLTGFMLERTEAAYAVDAALDIFEEQGLRTLTEAAGIVMSRVSAN